jgi:hypothetical protein
MGRSIVTAGFLRSWLHPRRPTTGMRRFPNPQCVPFLSRLWAHPAPCRDLVTRVFDAAAGGATITPADMQLAASFRPGRVRGWPRWVDSALQAAEDASLRGKKRNERNGSTALMQLQLLQNPKL